MLRINVIGGLGNQMYQYSFCRSLAEKLGYNFYVSNIGKNYHFGNENRKNNNNSLFDIFELSCGFEDGFIKNNFMEKTTLLNLNVLDINYKNNVLDTTSKIQDFTLLNGFYENPVYFDVDNALEWFKFDYSKYVDDVFFNNYNLDDYCIIHFRGKDFYNAQGLYLNCDYYKKAVKNIDINKYVILTDDMKLAEKEFEWMKSDNLEYHIMSNDMMFDFYLMTISKYLITSNSTFSHWGAYLNKNRNMSDSKIIIPYSKSSPYSSCRYYPIDGISFFDIDKDEIIQKP